MFGTYDRAALQRGFQVYKEVCSACHSVKHLSFRDLEELGYSEDQVKGIAAQFQVTDGPNDQGEMFQRPARPPTLSRGPFPNDQAARAANNGALPPDLSLIAKAREGGADYVYALPDRLQGRRRPDVKMNAGHVLQRVFPRPSDRDAAAADRRPGTYADGTKATVPQMAHDVANFLTWAAEPNLEERHRMGVKVILFLVIAAGVFYAAKRKIWARVH